MPTHHEGFELPVGLEGAMAAVSSSLGDLHDRTGWQRPRPSVARMECGQSFSLISFTNPVTVTITLEGTNGPTRVRMEGSNTGFGPIQGGHVRKVVQGLMERTRQRVGTGDGRVGGGAARANPGPGAGGARPVGGGPDGGPGTGGRRPEEGGPDHRGPDGGPGSGPSVGAPSSRGGPGSATPGGPKSERGGGRAAWGADRIFLSYRRDDSGHATDRISDRLERHFGDEAVFKDIDDIPFGVNFKTHIESVVQRADVLLAVVGREWAGPRDDGGARIDRVTDVVRLEIEASLARGIPVVPLFVNGGSFPTDLPDTLAELPYMNGMEIRRGHDFDADLERLVTQLEGILGPED